MPHNIFKDLKLTPVIKDIDIMQHTWRNTLVASWRVKPEILNRHLGPGLTADIFEGSAYISIVCLSMATRSLRPFWDVNLKSSFAQVNVRTYVRHNGVPGIYIFSLNIPFNFTAKIARRIINLPYRYAKTSNIRVENGRNIYGSVTVDCEAEDEQFKANYIAGSNTYLSVQQPLTGFLMERFNLFANLTQNTHTVLHLEHPPWLMRELVSYNILSNTLLPRIFQLDPSSPDHVGLGEIAVSRLNIPFICNGHR